MVAAAMALLARVLKEAVGLHGAFSLTLLNVGAGNFKEAAKRGPDGLAPALSRLLQGTQGGALPAAAPGAGVPPPAPPTQLARPGVTWPAAPPLWPPLAARLTADGVRSLPLFTPALVR